MAQRPLIWQLFPPYVLLVIVALMSIVGFASTSLRSFHLDHLAEDLRARSSLLEPQIHDLVAEQRFGELQVLVRSRGNESDTRITVMLLDGTVVADSSEEPAAMDNHQNRPEFLGAIDGGYGTATRFNDAQSQRMKFAAIPVIEDNEPVGVLRVGLPVDAVDAALWAWYLQILLGSAAVAILAVFASWRVSRRITRPLAELTEGAQRLAEGDMSHQLNGEYTEEIGALADAMNQMAVQLDDRIKSAVQQTQEQHAVLSSMVEGVLAIDTEGDVISINEPAAALLQANAVQSVGRPVQELVRNTTFQNFIKRALESDEPIEAEIAFYLDDERFFQTHGTLLRDPSGATIGAVVVLHDVTQLRRLERVRRDFVANVSHELRTPITSIKGFVETLIENPPQDQSEVKRFLSIIDKNSQHLNSLIGDLMSLSRIEQGDIPVEELMQSASMRDILVNVQTACQSAADRRGIDLVIDSGENVEMTAHPSLLQQAISNLVDNAIKYSESGKQVEVDMDVQDDRIRIVVRDHGAGISSEHIPRLFERFYRVDKARSREQGGTGLGLAIVKHIVELHRGRVSVQSELGRGTTFTLDFPRENANKTAAANVVLTKD